MHDDNDPLFSRATSHPLGKCTEPLKTLLPEQLHADFSAIASLAGMSNGEYLRDVVTEHVHGRLLLARLAVRGRFGRAG